MANKIDLIVKYSTEAFDEVYKADARSSLLDGNKKLMQFTGAKTVKIAKFTSDGLSDYSRFNTSSQVEHGPLTSGGDFAQAQGNSFNAGYGYQRADMGITWEERTLRVDRGAQYRVELFDNEETAELAVGLGTKQINKQVIVPEIDAYCFSEIAANVPAANILSADDTIGGTGHMGPVEALNSMFLKLDEAEVPAEDQVIFASPKFIQALRQSNEYGLVKPLLQSDMKKNVSFLVEEYEGRPIIMVPPSRFITNVSLNAKGFGPTAGTSKRIHCMLVAKEAVYHIVKYNKIKVFGPEVVQDYDGYKINARVYHDVFVPDNKKVALAMWTENSTIGASGNAYTLNVTAIPGTGTLSSDHKVKLTGISYTPASMMVGGLYYAPDSAASYASIALGVAISTITGAVAWTGGTTGDITTTANKLTGILVSAGGLIIGFKEIEVTAA